MNDLMIYVERIVRPIAATQRRKLRMRQELLGHLEAAVLEERERGLDEAAAVEGAKKRLGDGAELRRGLQKSVPWAERILLARLPMPDWANRWEAHTARHMGVEAMALGQAAVFTLGSMVVAYGTLVLLAMGTVVRYRSAMMERLSEQPWEYRLGHLVGCVLLLIIMGACFSIVGEVAKGRREMRLLMMRVLVLLGSLVGWMIVTVTMVAGSIPAAGDLIWSGAAGLVMVGGLILLGYGVRKMGRHYAPWMRLNVAEQ